MTQRVGGFPYYEIEFTKHGRVHDDDQRRAFVDAIEADPPDDLLVISHGWNNDMAEARSLYRRLLQPLGSDTGAGRLLAGRDVVVLAVLWPAKKFADEELIPSGAATFGSPITEGMLEDQLDELHGVFDGDDAALDEARELVPRLEDDPAARARFADLLRSVLPRDAADEEDGTHKLFELDGETLMDRLSAPIPLAGPPPGGSGGGASSLGGFGGPGPAAPPDAPTGGPSGRAGGLGGFGPGPGAGDDAGGAHDDVAGQAAMFGEFFGGFRAAARKLMNLTTYYQMKARSQVVADRGVHPILREIRDRHPDVRLHLVGHSFGARLVSATALGPEGQPSLDVDSVTLLQAAFSHHGFADDYDGRGNAGWFRRVVEEPRVRGPIVLTHTPNDKAVGLAYPVASMMAGQVASGFGDENSKYGALGRNGAQHTPEAVAGTLLDAAAAYDFEPGRIHNLRADRYVAHHGDVGNPETANAVAAAMTATLR